MKTLEAVADRLNPVLRGWGAYFRHGNSSDKFTTIDSYVNQRLAQLASHKHGLRGWNWSTRFNYRWANSLGIYRLSVETELNLPGNPRGTRFGHC